MLARGIDKLGSDDGGGDDLGGVDDFLDSRYTEGDVHRCDTGEVESFQSHLGSRLTNRLGTNGTNGRSGLDDRSQVSDAADFEEGMDLICRDLVGILNDLLNGIHDSQLFRTSVCMAHSQSVESRE